ncbi:MAG: TolC family protein [Candidatus Omnitrophica bacterium]|nr:TolC family protein [Candidatus Omnitrophota bacterium]MDD5487354.1 TolC family protein [Candidatus Omnitrophota bacterium]
MSYRISIGRMVVTALALAFVPVRVSAEEFSPAGDREVVTLSMEDCVLSGIRNSFEIRMAKLDLYIAETGVMYSEAVFDTFLYGGAAYSEDKRQQLSVFASDNTQGNSYNLGLGKRLPTGTDVSIELGDDRLWNNTAFVDVNPSHSSQLEVDIRQPVGRNMFGMIDRNNITLARIAVDMAALEEQDRVEAAIADIKDAYLELVFAKRSLDIYYGMLAKARQLYESDKKNHEIGLKEKVDLLASEANLTAFQADVLVAENSYKNAEERLKLKMNFADDARIVPSDELRESVMGMTLEECLKTAFEKRRDYEEKRKDVDAKGIELAIERNRAWPEIDLSMSFAMNGVSDKFKKAFGKTVVIDNTYYVAGVEFRVPLENSQARSLTEKAKQEKMKAITDLKFKERSIITEVVNAFNTMITFREGTDFLTRAVVLQADKLMEEEKRFRSGRSDTKKMIDYQQDLLGAELRAADSIYRERLAEIELERSMNVILDKYKELI